MRVLDPRRVVPVLALGLAATLVMLALSPPQQHSLHPLAVRRGGRVGLRSPALTTTTTLAVAAVHAATAAEPDRAAVPTNAPTSTGVASTTAAPPAGSQAGTAEAVHAAAAQQHGRLRLPRFDVDFEPGSSFEGAVARAQAALRRRLSLQPATAVTVPPAPGEPIAAAEPGKPAGCQATHDVHVIGKVSCGCLPV